MFKNSKGFTLAEVLIVLSILGMVAAITIPTAVRRHTELANKTRVKKALSTYEKIVASIIIENNLDRNENQLNRFISANNCENIKRYVKFSKTSGNNCRFLAHDGLWWDVSEFSNTIIAFKEEDLDAQIADGTDYKAFRLITRFDKISNYRVNDIGFASNTDYAISVITKNSNSTLGKDGAGHALYSSTIKNDGNAVPALQNATMAIMGVQKVQNYLNGKSWNFKTFPKESNWSVDFADGGIVLGRANGNNQQGKEKFEMCNASYTYCDNVGFQPADGSTWYGGSGGCYILGNVAYCRKGQSSRWDQTTSFGDNESIIEINNPDGTSELWHRFDLWKDSYSNLAQPAKNN